MFRYQVHSITSRGRRGRHLDWGWLFVGRRHVLTSGRTISFTLLLLEHQKVRVLLGCLQAYTAKSIRFSWSSKVFHFSLVTIVAFSLLDLLIHYCLVLCSVIGTFISQVDIVCTLSRSSLVVWIVCLLTQNWLIWDVSAWSWGCCRNSLGVIAFVRMKVDLLGARVNIIVRNDLANNFSNIWFIRKSLENVSCSMKLPVIRIIIPRNNWHGILRLKHVSDGWIVDDDYIGHFPAETSHIFDIGIRKPSAVLTEEFIWTILIGVNNIY